MKKLPNKLSRLLLVALEDLEALEARGVEIDMSAWVTYRGAENNFEPCSVCLAGAVMARRLPAPVTAALQRENRQDGTCLRYSRPVLYPKDIERKLEALDRLRRGDVGRALLYVGERRAWTMTVSELFEREECVILSTLSQTSRAEWLPHMLDLVGVLQAEGL
jgi:hypothetical protein